MTKPTDAAIANTSADAKHFAEVHYYSGGLRHFPVALGADRPVWAPSPEMVGFRDEFQLRDGAHVVEFRRLAHLGRRITWIAVYVSSTDLKFGDRGNHAGVGLWLNEQVVIRVDDLLDGLRQLANAISNAPAPEALSDQIRRFSSKFVPDFLTDLGRFPAELSGLPFSASQLAETTRYSAPGTDNGWRDVADKLAQLSLLDDFDGRCSRALLLVGGSEIPTGTLPLQRDAGLLVRLASAIPLAFERMDTMRGAAVAETAKLTNFVATQNTQLASAQSEAATLREELATAKAEAAKFDHEYTPSMSQAFERLNNRISVLANNVERLPSMIRQPTSIAPQPILPPTQQPTRASRPWTDRAVWAILVAVLALAGFIIITHMQTPVPAPAESPASAAAPAECPQNSEATSTVSGAETGQSVAGGTQPYPTSPTEAAENHEDEGPVTH